MLLLACLRARGYGDNREIELLCEGGAGRRIPHAVSFDPLRLREGGQGGERAFFGGAEGAEFHEHGVGVLGREVRLTKGLIERRQFAVETYVTEAGGEFDELLVWFGDRAIFGQCFGDQRTRLVTVYTVENSGGLDGVTFLNGQAVFDYFADEGILNPLRM